MTQHSFIIFGLWELKPYVFKVLGYHKFIVVVAIYVLFITDCFGICRFSDIFKRQKHFHGNIGALVDQWVKRCPVVLVISGSIPA